MTYGHAALNATSLSGTVEIDLIFPKNEVTYEPTPMMPMVWAVQNANLAATLGASISVSVQAVSHGGVDQADGASLPLTPANLTGKDVYYAYMYSMKFRWEDRVGISWNLNYGNRNCSQNIYFGDDGDDFGGTVTSFVDTKHGGEQVGDWAAAHAANCSNTENISINITGTRPIHGGVGNSTKDQCGLLARRWPALDWGTPCKVKVDELTATKVTKELAAAFTKAQCAAYVPIVNLTCPNAAGASLYVQSRTSTLQAVVFLTAAAAVAVACI